MKKTVRKICIICSIIGFILSILWWWSEGGYEPFIGIFSSFAVAVTAIFYKEKKKEDSPKISYKQKAGDDSNQYQSNGDMTINK